MSTTPELTKLLYYFWLPAGKDEFGFQHQERAPLNNTAFYRDHGHVEQTISKRLEGQARGCVVVQHLVGLPDARQPGRLVPWS